MDYNSAMIQTPDDPISARKHAIRETALARRAEIPAAQHAEYSERIRDRLLAHPAVTGAQRIFTFVSFGTEVDTHPIIDALLASGHQVATPRIMDATTIRAIPISGWQDLEPGKWGILSPCRTEPAPGPFDVAIIPGVAFTEDGARIGHGRGYYDRWIEANHVGAVIAPAFERQIVRELPMEPHDRPVDAIVTEDRLIEPAP